MNSTLYRRPIALRASHAPSMTNGWDGEIMYSFSTSPHSKGVNILTAKGLPKVL